MKTFITILSLFFILPTLSQEAKTYTISINKRTSVKEEYKELELLRSDTQSLLIIRNQKKERLPLNEKDSLRVVALMKSYDEKSKDELFSLINKTLAFEVDSIQIDKENQILGVADNFFRNRKKLNKQATENKDNRIILDGTTFKITVADSKGEPYVFYAHSPSKESHPEIYELISALDTTYRRH